MADWSNCSTCGKTIDWRDTQCLACELKERKEYEFLERFEAEKKEEEKEQEYLEWKEQHLRSSKVMPEAEQEDQDLATFLNQVYGWAVKIQREATAIRNDEIEDDAYIITDQVEQFISKKHLDREKILKGRHK